MGMHGCLRPSKCLKSFCSSSSVGRRSRSLLLPTRPRRFSAMRARSTCSMLTRSPWTAAAWEITSLMAPRSMLTVTGPAPWAARSRPNLIRRSRSMSIIGRLPSSRLSMARVADFERPGALPTSFMSAMCRSTSWPKVFIPFTRVGVGATPWSIWRSASIAQVRASSLRLKVSLIYRRLRRTTARQEPDGSLTNAANFVSSMCTVRCRTVAKNVVSRRKIECTRRDLTL